MKMPEVLISKEDLARRVGELAAEIEKDYQLGEDGEEREPDDPLVCVGVLTGSVFFMVDLLEEVKFLPVVLDFFQTSSYRGGTSAGEVRIRKDLDTPIRDRDVLLIEDIVLDQRVLVASSTLQ